MNTNQFKPSAPNPGSNAKAVALLAKQTHRGGKDMAVLIHDPRTRRVWVVRYQYYCCSYILVTLQIDLYVLLL